MYDYQKDAREKIEDILSRGKIPILVGGTGLYIKSLIYPYSFCSAPKDEKIREKYNKILEKEGKEYLYSLLKEKDSKACEKIHINDTKRVIRALEICEITGKAKTDMNIEETKSKYNYVLIALNLPRNELYERINIRVDKMFEEGLLNEITSVLEAKKLTENNQSMQAIGYKEFFEYFKNNLTLEETKSLIAKNSRNYAKRQITFIKGLKNVNWFNPLTDKDKILEFIKQELN